MLVGRVGACRPPETLSGHKGVRPCLEASGDGFLAAMANEVALLTRVFVASHARAQRRRSTHRARAAQRSSSRGILDGLRMANTTRRVLTAVSRRSLTYEIRWFNPCGFKSLVPHLQENEMKQNSHSFESWFFSFINRFSPEVRLIDLEEQGEKDHKDYGRGYGNWRWQYEKSKSLPLTGNWIENDNENHSHLRVDILRCKFHYNYDGFGVFLKRYRIIKKWKKCFSLGVNKNIIVHRISIDRFEFVDIDPPEIGSIVKFGKHKYRIKDFHIEGENKGYCYYFIQGQWTNWYATKQLFKRCKAFTWSKYICLTPLLAHYLEIITLSHKLYGILLILGFVGVSFYEDVKNFLD